MALIGSIGRRYARALLGAAAGAGASESVERDLGTLAGVLRESPELGAALSNPTFKVEERIRVADAVAERIGAHAITRDFLRLLVEKDRFDRFDAVHRAFEGLSDQAAGRVRATLTSATPLSDEVVGRIQTKLESATGKQVLLDREVDAGLIGGVVTRIGSQVYDGSVRTQIRRVREQLQKG